MIDAMADLTQSVFDTPAYNCLQAAQYIGVPVHTLRRWIGEDGLIVTPHSNALSFNNLAEAHILKAMRKVHGLPLQGIRKALAELARVRHSEHPLLDETFETDGVDLCIRHEDAVINLSRKGQTEFREFVSLYLHRIQRDDAGRVARLFPFVVAERADEPKSISISPTVSFGRPVLAGTGISTSVIVGRFNARDSVADLALEYQVPVAILEDAIRWEMNKGKAA
jgi:uncharacterized protein (DUF433 family)/DNA-binding transcriptional MerR regulator